MTDGLDAIRSQKSATVMCHALWLLTTTRPASSYPAMRQISVIAPPELNAESGRSQRIDCRCVFFILIGVCCVCCVIRSGFKCLLVDKCPIGFFAKWIGAIDCEVKKFVFCLFLILRFDLDIDGDWRDVCFHVFLVLEINGRQILAGRQRCRQAGVWSKKQGRHWIA